MGSFRGFSAGSIPASAAPDVDTRMNLATGEEPLGLGPREGDDPLGEDPLGGLLPRGRRLAVGRVLVTVASSAEGSGTAPQVKNNFFLLVLERKKKSAPVGDRNGSL